MPTCNVRIVSEVNVELHTRTILPCRRARRGVEWRATNKAPPRCEDSRGHGTRS